MSKRPTILLIEENPIVRDALGQALEREDFLVVQFPGESGGLSEEENFDVALVDVSYSRRNGFEKLRQLNQLKPSVPVILMSSYPELLNHPAAAHVSARMLKPLEMPLLCRTVRDLTVIGSKDRTYQPERCP